MPTMVTCTQRWRVQQRRGPWRHQEQVQQPQGPGAVVRDRVHLERVLLHVAVRCRPRLFKWLRRVLGWAGRMLKEQLRMELR